MALETAVVRATTPSTTGTVDFTASGFGTPVAAIFYLLYRGSDDTPNEDDAILSVGFTDGTTDRASSMYANDAAATTECDRGQQAYCVFQQTATVQKYGTFNSWITDGVRLNWTISGGSATFEIVAVLIKGVSAKVGTMTPNTVSGNTVSVTTLGFDPDAVFFTGVGVSSPGVGTHAIITYGCAVNDGSSTQRMAGWSNEDAVSAVDLNALLSTGRVGGQLFNGTLNWGAEVTAWPSGGFTLTTRDGGTGGDKLEYLAITDGGSNLSLQTVSSPTSTGTQNYSVTGTPHTAIGAMTNAASVDSVQTSGPGAEGIAFFAAENGTGEFCVEVGDDDAASTSATWNLFATKLIDKRYSSAGTVTAHVAASVNGWNSGALQLNWTTVDASARKGWVLIASDSGGSTFTGSGTLSAAAATSSGSGTHTAPVYTGSGTPAAAAATCAGSGTFTAPVYTGSGAVTAAAATTAGSGTHSAPGTFTGTGALSAPAAAAAGSGTFTAPVYTGSGAPATAAATCSGSGTYTAPGIFTGNGALSAAPATASGAGTHAAPVYTGSGAPAVAAATASGTGEFWTNLATGALTASAATCAGTGTHTASVAAVPTVYTPVRCAEGQRVNLRASTGNRVDLRGGP